MNGPYLDLVDIFLWHIMLLTFFIIIVYFIEKYRKMEAATRSFIGGVIFFITAFTLSRVVETIRRYVYETSSKVIYETNFSLTGLDLVLRLSYYVFIWIGIAIFYFVFEKYVMNNRTKYLLMMTSIITTFLSFVMYFTGWSDLIFALYAVCFFIVGLFPIVLFVYLSRTSPSREQRIAWLLMIGGFLLLLLGVLGDMPEAYFVTQNLDPTFIRYFTPLGQAAGAVLMAFSLSKIYKYV
ncbi:MAG: hypothetical protein HWN65_21355 [Candidatus Helarchaeota archaeon]|nr:hypothetical protein [Candidatus Helarchaeota archaeon]